MNRVKILAHRIPYTDMIGLLIGDGGSVVRNVVFEPLEEGVYAEPSLIIDNSEAQRLMDELWACGLRPSEGTGSAGAMAATQAHLADMRRLVFDREQS